MENDANEKSLDPNTERASRKRAEQSRQKPVPGQAPLKEHGQPAWREVRPK